MKSITVEELEKLESDQRFVVDIRQSEQFLRGTFLGEPVQTYANGLRAGKREEERGHRAQHYQEIPKNNLATVYQSFK